VSAVFCRFLAVIFLLLGLSGCAGLPARLPMSETESATARESFKEMAGRQRLCETSVDAELIVTLESRFYRGTLNGYLQATAPSFVKLVGINPLGQPLAVLVSGGERFNYALLGEKLIYEGAVDSDAYRRYTPAGIDPAVTFYTLTGKLPPGEVRILSVSNDEHEGGVWLDLERNPGDSRSLVLFDPDRQVIRRYLKIAEDGGAALDITYGDYGGGDCKLPGLLTAVSRDHAGKLTIRLSDWRTGFPSAPGDFELELPTDFKRVKVN
jgi:hypothetical protein